MNKTVETSLKPASGKVAFWYDPRKRSIFYQLGVMAMVGLLGYYLVSNTLANLERQAIATGFGFLQKEPLLKLVNPLFPIRLPIITCGRCWSEF